MSRMSDLAADAAALGLAKTDEWQPIATAPRDGTVILLARPEYVVAGWWSDAPETRTRYGVYPWCIIEDQPEFDADGTEAAGAGVIRPNGWQDNAEGPTHWRPLPHGPRNE